MRLIDADEAKKLDRMFTLKPSERNLFRLMLDRMPTYEPSNDTLTLDELREMDGEPVWIERRDGGTSGWAIVGDADSLYGVYFVTVRGGMRLPYGACGDMWRAFRRKPEEA